MQFLGGILSDCYGRKWLITLPSFALIPLLFLAGKSSNWLTLTWVLVAINSLSSIQIPSFFSIIAESTSPPKRGMAFGVFEFFSILGETIGAALGAMLITFWKLNTYFTLIQLLNLYVY